MAQLTNAQILAKYNDSSTGLFKDNTNREIVPNRPRSLTTDLTDSFFNKLNDAYSGAKGQRAGITAPASLKDIVTTTLTLGVMITFTDSTASNVVRIYELTNETTAESSPTVIRPNDYATTTNERVWRLRVTADVDSDTGGGGGVSAWGDLTGTVTDQTDLVAYVDSEIDSAITGLKWKNPARIATTTGGTLASDFENGDTIDGVVLETGDRILLKNQTDQTANGIYTVNASGAPTRATDADTAVEVEGAAVTVLEGTTNANTSWIQTTDNITLGSSNLIWTQFGTGSTTGVAREFDRTFATELLFDKNMIEAALHVQTDDIIFTVSESGNLVNQESIYGQRIQVDGIHPIYFPGFNHLANISSGEILEAGTYQFIFWYSNSIIRGSVMLPSMETVMLTPLSMPANFAAVPGAGDPDVEVDLSADAVTNAVSYETDFSTTGGAGPWTNIPTATGLTFTHTGRTPDTTYHYRKRAIGDGIAFANSTYATAVTTTENSGDVTAPTAVFLPADAATAIALNKPMVITLSEPIRDSDGVTAITDANVDDYLVVKVDNGAGADIPNTPTIDITKTIITIDPNVVWPTLDNVFIQISGVEDVNGNDLVTDDATFATSDYTIMENNHKLNFGSQVDSVIAGTDVNFEIEFEFKDIVLGGSRVITSKHESVGNQVSHVWRTNGDSVSFKYYKRTSSTAFSSREVTWANALTGITQAKLTVKYFGAIDTNDGLDRLEFYIDDVLITTGKTLTDSSDAVGAPWPWDTTGGTAPFELAGPTFREVKNFIVRNNMGATTIIDVPIIRTGTDTSGNSFDGTWI